jgi:hypothetical protein
MGARPLLIDWRGQVWTIFGFRFRAGLLENQVIFIHANLRPCLCLLRCIPFPASLAGPVGQSISHADQSTNLVPCRRYLDHLIVLRVVEQATRNRCSCALGKQKRVKHRLSTVLHPCASPTGLDLEGHRTLSPLVFHVDLALDLDELPEGRVQRSRLYHSMDGGVELATKTKSRRPYIFLDVECLLNRENIPLVPSQVSRVYDGVVL